MNDRVKSKNNVITIILTLIIVVLSLYPMINNYKYNDHSKNWLNHDYGKNLLSSTEEYSVFMTEGGDNQVFSSLYFTYAEKLRQDLFPYDQKGNIFKRIYGDLRYVTYETLQERTGIVNEGLFTGQEPFYTDIRSNKKPYLVPYALGKPATYLTWRLPDQQLLGDYYYKNYGLMYKVQEIRYAIIDYIETIGSASLNDIQKNLEELLNRSINPIEINIWIDQLVQDGYITKNQSPITFLKSYPKPFKKDPTDNFITRWEDIPNLQYYDYLSREIVISFSYEQISLLDDKIGELQKLIQIEESPEVKKALSEDIQKYWKQIENYINIIKTVGFDSAATLHNLGIFYLTAPQKFNFVTNNLIPNAVEVWEMTIQNAPYSWATYNVLMWSYIREAILNQKNAQEYLVLFDTVFTQMTNNMSHWKSMKTNIVKAAPYQNIQQLLTIRKDFNTFSGPQFFEEQSSVIKMINESDELNLELLRSYFTKIINQLNFLDNTQQKLDFFELWLKAWEKHQANPDFFEWHVSLLGELSGYGDIIDTSIFTITAQEGQGYLTSKKPTSYEDLPLFINMFKIARASQNTDFVTLYRQLLLINAQNILPPDQYTQFKTQIDQL